MMTAWFILIFIPLVDTPRKIGWGCAARFPKSLTLLWPKYVISLPYL